MGLRRESVEIHVSSNLGPTAIKDAAGVKLAARALDSLSRSAVQSDRATQRITQSLPRAGAAAQSTARSVRKADTSINQLTGRLRLLADIAALIGPALAPVGVLAVPAVAGLANQLGFASLAAGTAVLAFGGVGDAVTALNDYALEPTAANAEKVQAAMAKLGPEARRFSREIAGMREQFAATRGAAAGGLFGELTGDALDDLDGLLARVQPVLREIGSVTGEILADGLDNLDSTRWQPFFSFLQAEARPVLSELAHTAGDFTYGLTQLWMAFQPLNRDFSGFLAGGASGFADWADGLEETQGFAEFMDYVRTSGPQVASTAKAVGSAVLDIAEAAAPLGGPALAGIEAFANVVSAIADSDLGTPLLTAVAAAAALNRVLSITSRVAGGGLLAGTRSNLATFSSGLQTAQTRAMGLRSSLAAIAAQRRALATGANTAPSWVVSSQAANRAATLAANADRARESLRGMAGSAGRVAGPMAGMTLAMSGAGDGMTGANTAMMALMGSAAGLPGALAGGAIGAVLDLAAANDDLEAAVTAAQAAIDSGDVQQMEKAYSSLNEEIAVSEAKMLGFSMTQVGRGPLGEWLGETIFGVKNVRGELETLDGALSKAGGSTSRYGSSTDFAAGAARRAAQNVAELTTQMRAQAEQAGSSFDAQTAWGQAVADARKQAASGAKGIDAMTEAGRANRGALSQLRTAWNGQSRAVKNNVDRYRAAKSTFIDVATQMGLSAGEARKLARRMLEMPKKVVSRVGLQGEREANRALQGMDNRLHELNRRRTRPKVDPDTRGGQKTIQGMDNRLRQLDKRKVTPTLDSNSGPAMRKLRALERANRRFGGSRWESTLDLNDAPAGRKLGAARQKMSQFAGLKATGQADVNNTAGMRALGQVDTRMKQVGGLKATTDVDSNTAGANSKLGGHASYLASIDGRTSSTYVNNYITTIRRERVERAGGGLVLGAGTTTSDSIPAMLSNREYVVRAAAVDKYGVGFFDDANAMRFSGGGLAAREQAGVAAAMRSTGGRGGGRTVLIQQPGVLRGRLDTPWGPADVEVIARGAAQDVYDDNRDADERHDWAQSGRVYD